jgi:hypothetical protein
VSSEISPKLHGVKFQKRAVVTIVSVITLNGHPAVAPLLLPASAPRRVLLLCYLTLDLYVET